MANTYSQIHIQVVFAVETRQNLIRPERRDELEKYISGIIRERDQKLMAIYCMPDHTHLLIGLRPSMALADLVREVKSASSKFIQRGKWVPGRFSWQEGFGAFSYGQSQVPTVIRYILNQEKHHARKSFQNEYTSFLLKFGIDYDPRYVLRDPE